MVEERRLEALRKDEIAQRKLAEQEEPRLQEIKRKEKEAEAKHQAFLEQTRRANEQH